MVSKPYKFLFAEISAKEAQRLTYRILNMNATICETTALYDPEATHIVVPKFVVNEQTLGAMAAGKWIVHTSFIYDSYLHDEWLLEVNYEMRGKTRKKTKMSKVRRALLTAPRRCRELVMVKGKPLFSNWKVGILVPDELKRNSIKRVLLSGGAYVVELKWPITDLWKIAKEQLQCIITDLLYDHCKPLIDIAVTCVTPSYIEKYVLQDPSPEMEEFELKCSTSIDRHEILMKRCRLMKAAEQQRTVDNLEAYEIPTSVDVSEIVTDDATTKELLADNQEADKDNWRSAASSPVQRGESDVGGDVTKSKDIYGENFEDLDQLFEKIQITNPENKSYDDQAEKKSILRQRDDNIKQGEKIVEGTRRINCPKSEVKLSTLKNEVHDESTGTQSNKDYNGEAFKINASQVQATNHNSFNGLKKESEICSNVPTVSSMKELHHTSSVTEAKQDVNYSNDVNAVDINHSNKVGCSEILKDSSGTSRKTKRSKRRAKRKNTQHEIVECQESNAELDSIAKSTRSSKKFAVATQTVHREAEESGCDSGESVENATKIAFYQDFDKPAERFKLQLHIPLMTECIRNPYSCPKNHRMLAIEMTDAETKILEMVIDDRAKTDSLATFCTIFIKPYVYPGASFFVHLLNVILNTHEPNLVNSAAEIFKMMIEQHPPCAPCMRQYYQTLLMSTVKDCKQETRNGIMLEMIERMSEFLSEEPRQSIQEKENADAPRVEGKYSPKSDCNLDLETLESLEDEKNYSTLSREVKMERVVQVCVLLIELMEQDLVVLLVKKHCDFKKEICTKTKPLFVTFLWGSNPSTQVGRVSTLCKNIIDLFVRSVVLGLCYNIKQLFVRLLTLMAEVAFAVDFREEFEYPFFGTHCQNLAQEIGIRCLGLSVEKVVKVGKQLNPTWLRLLFTNFIIAEAMHEEPFKKIRCLDQMAEWLEHQRVPTGDIEDMELDESKVSQACSISSKKQSVNINKKNAKGETRLHRVCRNGKVKELKELLQDPKINVNAVDNCGWTPLHEAVNYGRLECVELLLSYVPKGGNLVNINARSETGITPMMDAVIGNHVKICEKLLLYGGSALLLDKYSDGKTLFEMTETDEMQNVLKHAAAMKLPGLRNTNVYKRPLPVIVIKLIPIILPCYVHTYRFMHILRLVSSGASECDFKDFHLSRENKMKLRFDFTSFNNDYESILKIYSFLEKLKDNVIEYRQCYEYLNLVFCARNI